MTTLKIDGKDIRDHSGNRVGEIDGSVIRDKSGSRILEIDGQKFRNQSGSCVAELDSSGNIRDSSGRTIATVRDIEKEVDGLSKTNKVATWVAFLK